MYVLADSILWSEEAPQQPWEKTQTTTLEKNHKPKEKHTNPFGAGTKNALASY